jgi:hypothetical protein
MMCSKEVKTNRTTEINISENGNSYFVSQQPPFILFFVSLVKNCPERGAGPCRD